MAHRPGAGVFGPLRPLIADASVTDVLVTGERVWVDRGRGVEPVSLRLRGQGRSRALAVSLIAAGGRHLDDANPCVDVRLPGGVRVHAVLPPVAIDGVQISVRVPAAAGLGFDQLCASGTIPFMLQGVMRGLVARRASMLVVGSTGAGKTTLLAALLGLVPHDQRIVTVEDVAELRVRHPHVVQLEARQANTDGAGGIGLDRLVLQALRMRPDRLVVGECRGPELRELLTALNTGHEGGALTMHANSVGDTATRLEALGALTGLDAPAIARQAVSALDVVLHVARGTAPGGGRRLTGVGVLELDANGSLHTRVLWRDPVDGDRAQSPPVVDDAGWCAFRDRWDA